MWAPRAEEPRRGERAGAGRRAEEEARQVGRRSAPAVRGSLRGMKPKISIVTLGVADVPRAAEFYLALGLPVHRDAEGDHVMFRMEGSWLALYPRDLLAADATVPAAGGGFSGVTLAHNVASKEAVDATLEEARTKGATLVKPGQDAEWGGYSGYFADPDGHLWEVAWNPFTDLT